MAFYTICGQPNCKLFAHAIYVAQYLADHLPNFKYQKILKSKQEWPDYVDQLNKKNKWCIVKSPIIWKEISSWGGKSYLLGGLGEFWDYCNCYFGLESNIPREDLEKLARDNLKYYKETIYSKEHRKYKAVFSVFFDLLSQVEFIMYLIEELLQIPAINADNGLFIKLYCTENNIEHGKNNDKEKGALENIVEYFNSLAIFGDRPLVEIVQDEADALSHTDLLIFSEDFTKNLAEEDDEIWIKRCYTRMTILADLININAKRELRVIFCNDGPMCFMATCLIEYCTVLIPNNIIALAADKGLSVISVLSEMTGLPVGKIGAPPVWGFLGINEFVDEANIIFKAHILKPFKRALTAPTESTLPLGTKLPELRLMSYMVPHKHAEIQHAVIERKKIIEERLHRKSFLNKLIALKSLLILWFSDADESFNKIISLGVCSDGSHGIPPGLVFSQPSIQDHQKRRWRPFSACALINDENIPLLKEIIAESLIVAEKIGLRVNDSFINNNDQISDDDVLLLNDSVHTIQ